VKILVTGATSFLGAPLARRLVKSGHDVRVLSRSGRAGRRLVNAGVTPFAGDIRDAHAVARAAAGREAIVHFAYAPVSAPPREVIDTAVLGMASVLRACELHGVRDLVLASSPRVHDPVVPLDPRSCYGEGKRASEAMAAAWCKDGVLRRAIIARVFNAYGPDMGLDHVIPQFAVRMDDLVKSGLAGTLPFTVRGSGNDVRSFVYVDDAAVQLCTLLDRAGPGAAIFDVGSPDEMTIAALAHAVAACFGQEVTIVPQSPHDGNWTVRVPGPGIPALPAVSFGDGLKKTVEWYRENRGRMRDG